MVAAGRDPMLARQDGQRPRRWVVVSRAHAAAVGLLNFTGAWLLGLVWAAAILAVGIEPAYPHLLDWLAALLGELTFLRLVTLVALAPVMLRMLRIAGRVAAIAFALVLAATLVVGAVMALLAAPWVWILEQVLGGAAVVAAVGAAGAALAFLVRDVDWRAGTVHLAPWNAPSPAAWWDTSALDEDDDDPYEAMREGHPYDEVAILFERLGNIYGDRDA